MKTPFETMRALWMAIADSASYMQGDVWRARNVNNVRDCQIAREFVYEIQHARDDLWAAVCVFHGWSPEDFEARLWA